MPAIDYFFQQFVKQIEFTGSKDGNCFNSLYVFGNPQVWNTCFVQFFA